MVSLPQAPSFRLDGKRAIVIGASSGIGLGCVVALAEAGAEVTLAARGIDKLREVQRELSNAGMATWVVQLDISKPEDVKNVIDAQLPFDILVNSAGMAAHSPAFETAEPDFDAVINTNLKGAYFITRAVAKKLADAGRTGSLVNISSQMGHVGGVDRAVYCASKHAVEGFTKAMAIEWGKLNIRVNTVCPTFIRTPLSAITLQNQEQRRWIEDKIKLGRVGEIEDVMGAVVFLASDASAMVTGTSLLIDGGWTAG